MKPTVIDAVNKQIHLEFEAAMLYLKLSVGLQEYGLPGCSRWLRLQFHEECGHALELIDYLAERRVSAAIPSLVSPVCEWQTPLDVFQAVLEHEQRVTTAIEALVGLSRSEADYATEDRMMRFVREQVEEENAAADIVDCLRLTEGNSAAMLSIDRRLGKRREAEKDLMGNMPH